MVSRILLVVLLLAPSVATPALLSPNDELTFHLTDLGINQTWDKNLRPGDPFLSGPKGHTSVFSGSSTPVAQILVPMPSDLKLTHSYHDQLVAEIKADLSARIQSEVATGVRDFEIQFVQNVRTAGYFDPIRQNQITKFGKAAYAAFGEVLDDLSSQTNKIAVDGTFASNGTTMFAKSAAFWQDYADLIQRVSWVDGRAMEADARKTLEVLDPRKVRVFNSHGDLPAATAQSPFLGSIANHDVARSIQRDYPGLKVFKLTPQDADKTIGNTGIVKPLCCHILSVSDSHTRFRAEQHFPDDIVREYGELTGRDLHPAFRFGDYHRFSGNVPSAGRSQAEFGRLITTRSSMETLLPRVLSRLPDRAIRVDSKALSGFSETMRTLADRLATANNLQSMTEQGFANAKSKLPDSLGHLKDLHDLLTAVEKDVARSSIGRYTPLSSHTVEQLYRFGLSWVTDAENLKTWANAGKVSWTFARRLGYLTYGADDIAAGIGRMIGAGRWDEVDGVTGVLDGLNKTAWGTVGYLVSGGNSLVGNTFASVADVVASTARDLTLPAFERAYAKFSGLDRTLIEGYVTAQNRRRASGKSAQTFEEYWNYDKSIINKLSPRQLRTANGQFGLRSMPRERWHRPRRIFTRTRTERYRETCHGGYCSRVDLTAVREATLTPFGGAPSIGHASDGSTSADPSHRMGGVEMDVNVRSGGAAPSGIRDRVLNARTAEDGASWDLHRQ